MKGQPMPWNDRVGATPLRELWERTEALLERLEVVPSRIKHVMASRDASVLAELVADLQKGIGRKPSG